MGRPPVGRPPMGRPPPPYGYPPVRRRRSRRPLIVLILVLVTIVAGGYLYVSHRSSGSTLANDFVSVDQRVAAGARSLPVAAHKVERFDDRNAFNLDALKTLNQMIADQKTLQKIAKTQTGPSRQIADQAATAAGQAVTAALLYRNSVAFTFDLTAADRAEAAMLSAAATLDQQAHAWQTR